VAGNLHPRVTRYRESVHRLIVVLMTLAVLTPSVATASPSRTSGLRGLVTLYPARPVCIEDQPCSKPAANAVLVFRRDGRAVARISTGADGTYRVKLRPGRYTVVAPAYRAGSGVTPRTVRVPKGRIARVDFEIDTGIQ
jgi:hypothetical protein